LRVPRHLVIATRVNPNATSLRTRRIQVRAWNRADGTEEPRLGAEGAIGIVAANLFGLFKALGLREIASAIALSVQQRSQPYGQAFFDLKVPDATHILERAERELDSIRRPNNEASHSITAFMSIQTEVGPDTRSRFT
jgi:hypothetical protein